MVANVDPGEAYGHLLAVGNGGMKGVIPVEARMVLNGNIWNMALAYSFSEDERAEIATGARLLLHFANRIPIHGIQIEGLIYDARDEYHQ